MVTVWDWFWQLLALGLIIFILRRLLFQPVSDFIEKRRAAIAEDVNSATDAKKQANNMKAEYENKIKNINNEADEILKNARAKALAREQQIIDEAKEEANAIRTKATADIKLEQEKAKAEMKAEMIEVAALMASKFVTTSIDDAKQTKLISEVIDEMGDVSWLS
ncbi:MAG: ATP synthase F0 subunit B [Epulopiscium sp. Nele67-Bin004]|nr:MAG: ATP synthase F0 subunit B [Epulopiscium sp. Nele67-Bin004]